MRFEYLIQKSFSLNGNFVPGYNKIELNNPKSVIKHSMFVVRTKDAKITLSTSLTYMDFLVTKSSFQRITEQQKIIENGNIKYKLCFRPLYIRKKYQSSINVPLIFSLPGIYTLSLNSFDSQKVFAEYKISFNVISDITTGDASEQTKLISGGSTVQTTLSIESSTSESKVSVNISERYFSLLKVVKF